MTTSRRILLTFAIAVIGVIAVTALFPTLLTATDPLATDVRSALEPPSSEHWFGTDQSGRDVLARVVHGAARSVGTGVMATLIAVAGGLVIGSVTAMAPRIVDAAIMRIVDIVLAFPEFLVALIIVAILGPSPFNVALAVTISMVPVYVRLARIHAKTLRDAEYVEAARLLGVSAPRAFVRHVLPGVLGSLSVVATIGVGTSILAVAGLSFLGLGPTEPAPEWGLMLSAGRNLLAQAWWVGVFPGLAITLTVVAFTIMGRTLRDASEGMLR